MRPVAAGRRSKRRSRAGSSGSQPGGVDAGGRGTGVRGFRATAARDRGARLGVVRLSRGDQAIRVQDTGRHSSGRPRDDHHGRPELQLRRHPRVRQAGRLQQPDSAAHQRPSRERQRVRPSRSRRRVRARSSHVRADRDHPGAGVGTIRRQCLLCGRERHHENRCGARHLGVGFAVAATVEGSSGVPRIYFPAFDTPASNNGVAEHLDGQHVGQFYGRLQFGGFTLTSAYGRRQKDVPTASFGTVFQEQEFQQQTTDRHTLIDGEYAARPGGTRVSLRVSFDRFSYDGVYPFGTDQNATGVLVGLNDVVGDRYTVGGRASRMLPKRQTLTGGVEYTDNTKQIQRFRFVDPPELLFALNRPSRQAALYAQHEVQLPGSVSITTGVRYDRYAAFSRVTPRVATVWMPTHNQSFKYLYGVAFRAPNAYEMNSFYFGDAVLGLRPETIGTHELVWERYTGDWLRTSASGYWYQANRLITLTADPAAPLATTYVNEGRVRAHGLELEAQFRSRRRLEGMLSYALQEATDRDTGASLLNSPRQMFKGRVSMPIVTRGSSIATEVITISSRTTRTGTTVPAATTMSLSVVQPLQRSFEVFALLRNVFDARVADPVSDSLLQNVIYQNGRTFQVGLRWKLRAQ